MIDEEKGNRPPARLWGAETICHTYNAGAAAAVERFARESLPSVVQVAVSLEEVPALTLQVGSIRASLDAVGLEPGEKDNAGTWES